MKQLHLPISLEPNATYNNYFCATPYATKLVNQLRSLTAPIIISGEKGTGKTHLLQASCHHTKRNWFYLNCANIASTCPSILENLDSHLVCIDNVEFLNKNKKWEEALFKLLLSSSQLILSTSSAQIPLHRADVTSRLSAIMTFKLPNLNDQEQHKALQHRAQKKGIPIAPEVFTWMQKNLPRNNQCLFDFIDTLEIESSREKRKPSIMLAKKIWEATTSTEKTG